MPSPESDLRIFCHEPYSLRAELQVSNLAIAQELREGFEADYSPGRQSLVPNPHTIRAATREEQAYYVRDVDELGERKQSDVLVYRGDAVYDFLDTQEPSSWKPFGHTSSPAGQLTTTASNQPGLKEGMHVDSGVGYTHRLGVCVSGARKLLAVSHSAPHLFNEEIMPTTGDIMHLLTTNRQLLSRLACLHIPLKYSDIYDAYTGAIIHDGSTWLNTTASEIFFTAR